MNFLVSANSDIGNVRKTNQDSVSVLRANTPIGQVAFAVVCDGMGGLAKGEMASATVMNTFNNWFKGYFSQKNINLTDSFIVEQWSNLITNLNKKIGDYGNQNAFKLGTTITAILVTPYRFYVVNVGDSRTYEIKDNVRQITEDQTVVAQEVKYGRLTAEQAKVDPRNSVLLQCIGASKVVKPDFFFGNTTPNTVFMLCSDGFRHCISEQEIFNFFNPNALYSKDALNMNSCQLIDINKQRMERDNISVVLIKTY